MTLAKRWLREYLEPRGGRADYFEMLQAAYDVDPYWDRRFLRDAIEEMGGRCGPPGWQARWEVDLHQPTKRVPPRPERPAGRWPK